jgi:REJ domain
VQVQAYPAPLVALVLGGNSSLCVGSVSPAVLDASGSYDPTASGVPTDEALRFNWTCQRRAIGSSCSGEAALALALSQASGSKLIVRYSDLGTALELEDSSAGAFSR